MVETLAARIKQALGDHAGAAKLLATVDARLKKLRVLHAQEAKR